MATDRERTGGAVAWVVPIFFALVLGGITSTLLSLLADGAVFEILGWVVGALIGYRVGIGILRRAYRQSLR